MVRIAVSISHEADYAVAIAFGVRTAGGRYVFPLDIEARLDDRERRLLARMDRLRALHERGRTPGRGRRRGPGRPTGSATVADRPVGFGRRDESRDRDGHGHGARRGHARRRGRRRRCSRSGRSAATRARSGRSSSSPARSTTPAPRCSSVAPPAGRAPGLVTLAVPESLQPLFAAKVVEATTMALPEDDVEEVDPEPSLARILDHDHDAIVVGPGLRPGLATAELVRQLLAVPADDDRRRSSSTPRRCARWRRSSTGGRATAGWAVLTPHSGRVRAAPRGQRPRARRGRRPRRRRRRPGCGRPGRGRRRGARSSS